jgi:hypothetical protein
MLSQLEYRQINKKPPCLKGHLLGITKALFEAKEKPITNTQKLANKSLLIWVLFFQPNRG